MFETMRARLTLWYTGVLALVLVLFAGATYFYLARAAQERVDQSLADTAASIASNFAAELNDEEQSGAAAAAEVARNFELKDRQAIIFDQDGHVVAATDAPVDASGHHPWPALATLAQSLDGLLKSAKLSGHAYGSVSAPNQEIRAFAVLTHNTDPAYLVVIAHPLKDQAAALEQARHAFYFAIPLALALASLGGYFLARKSLAPVIEIGDKATHISAANLGARLPVPDQRSELGRLARIFNDLLERLDLAFEQQRRFMADASHELRTPVAIVCGESEVALSQKNRNPEDYRESLAIVHDEGRRLTRIVEDLFMLARADAGQYRPDFESFYLDETVSECVRAVRSLATQRGLKLDFQPANDELLFRGDEGLIRRMVLNLLDNAIKHTPTGGQVRVEIRRADSLMMIRITDTGSGIPVEAQPHIFERFYRVDKARSRDGQTGSGGAGLGLSIAAWIAEMHGGRITLEESGEGGSAFLISLPAPAEVDSILSLRLPNT